MDQAQGDFLESIRAFIIDRDQKPRWKVSSLEQVTPEMVDQFAPSLPAKQQPTQSQQGLEEKSSDVDAVAAEASADPNAFRVKPDDYAEIFHETYTNYESLVKDTQTYVGGVVPVHRDWQRSKQALPPRPKPGQTGSFGW